MKLVNGIPACYRSQAINLYLIAFSQTPAGKLLTSTQCCQLLDQTLDLNFALAAISDDQLLGLAGYQTAEGSFTGASSATTLIRSLGIRICTRLMLRDGTRHRPLRAGEMLHDGLVVCPSHRGKGVAKALLTALADYSKQQQLRCLRLDVATSNHRALSLYQAAGYRSERLSRGRVEDYLTLRRYL